MAKKKLPGFIEAAEAYRAALDRRSKAYRDKAEAERMLAEISSECFEAEKEVNEAQFNFARAPITEEKVAIKDD